MKSHKRTIRPHVSVNMAMSLDGRISTRSREHITLGTRHDRLLMDRLRAGSDAVIVGAGTVRHDGYPILVRDDTVREKRLRGGGTPHPVNVVLSRALDIPASRGFFSHAETKRILFTTRAAPPARVKRFARVADVVVLPTATIQPTRVLEHLAARGLKRVLLEGGGEVHFAFVKDDCVDDIYVTLTPRLIGGVEAPSILDGRGFLSDEHRRLTLKSCRRVGDELFLRYAVIPRTG